jgi:uncharacterized membrane protein
MISIEHTAATTAPTWIIQPTRSLSWPEVKRCLWLLSLIPACSGLFFLFLGAPLVLPFAGLEIALLWGAFYYVSHTGRWREVVRLEGEQLVIEKGRDRPLERHRFDTAWVRVDLEGAPYRWHPSRLLIRSHGRGVELGRFLTDGERELLAKSLINAIRKNR